MTGCTRDFLTLLYPVPAICTAGCPDLAKGLCERVGGRLRAAFLYYIHGPSPAAGNLPERLPQAACGCRIPASLGGRRTPRPYDRGFLPPLCGSPLTFLRAAEASVRPGLRARPRGGALPATAGRS